MQLNLLWDSSTGEAPWSFSTAHMVSSEAPSAPAVPGTTSRCEVCVIPGCRLPTNRHHRSAYCTAVHAQQDEGAPNRAAFYYATAAGFHPDGAPLEASERAKRERHIRTTTVAITRSMRECATDANAERCATVAPRGVEGEGCQRGERSDMMCMV